MATCIDEILCENAFGCDITVLDSEGNPVNKFDLETGDTIVLVISEKPGYNFLGWYDENGIPYRYEPLGENRYKIDAIDCNSQYIAKYCAVEYRITLIASSNCFPSYVYVGHYGDIIPIKAEDTFNCRFLNWYKDGTLFTEERNFDYVVTGNATFVANYDAIKYRITAKPNKTNRGTCTGSDVYAFGEQVTLSAFSNYGYYFEKWDDGVTSPTRTVTVMGNKTYVALFGVEEIIVDVPITAGGSVIGGGTYKSGNVVSLQAIPQPGWFFSHWRMGNEISYEKTFNFISSENVTVIPFFEESSYEVTFVASPYGKGYFSPNETCTHSYGEILKVEAIPNVGYKFEKWGDGFSEAKRTITVSNNSKYVAYFSQVPTTHTITVVSSTVLSECFIYAGYKNVGQKTGNATIASFPSGTKIELAPTIPEGKKLVSVTDNDGNTVWDATNEKILPSLMIPYVVGNNDAELTLNYDEVTYTVSVSAEPIDFNTSGNISINVSIGDIYDIFLPTTLNTERMYNSIPFGTKATFSATSNVGNKRFSYWLTGNGSFTTPTINVTVDKNMKCVAIYK